MSPRALPILFLLLSAGPAQGLAASAPLAEKARAVLQQHCLSCHGEARISGLDLRQRESLLKGGDSGPAIVPGHPEESLLYRAVLQTGELKMPVGGALSPEEVEVLREMDPGGGSLGGGPSRLQRSFHLVVVSGFGRPQGARRAQSGLGPDPGGCLRAAQAGGRRVWTRRPAPAS